MKKVIFTEKAPTAIGAYSQAVEVNGMLFVSGQIPLDPVTMKIVDGGIIEQTERVLHNIEIILNAAGYNVGDVVKATILLDDISNFAEVNQIYSKVFAENPPARATYEVGKLPMGAMLEIETIAVKK